MSLRSLGLNALIDNFANLKLPKLLPNHLKLPWQEKHKAALLCEAAKITLLFDVDIGLLDLLKES